MTESEVPAIDPYEGFEYHPDTVAVSAEHQQEKLAVCGLDASIYAGAVDPSFFIGLSIQAGVKSGISAEGNVNMLQALVQHRSVLLGEELTAHGRITGVTRVPRGRTIDTDCWFEDADGNRVITAGRRSLRPDPDAGSKRGAGERPPLVIEDVSTLNVADRHQLTPEGVKGYSMEGNSIHYDMAAANRSGFRAPLIGGGMGVHYFMATLWQVHAPTRFDMDIYFRRPIFWDDALFVGVQESEANQWSAICVAKVDNGVAKVATEARINALG